MTSKKSKIQRDALCRHLEKIRCRGQVKEAVFTGAFGTVAMTPDTLLLVKAEPLADVEPLTESIGVADLKKLIKALNAVPGEGNAAADVQVELEDDELVISEGRRGTIKLLTASPTKIATRVEQGTVDKLTKKAPAPGVLVLTKAFVDGIQKTFALLKAAQITINVGPDGSVFVVGAGNSDRWEFEAEELKATEAYSLLFGEHLVDVLAGISNFSEATLRLTGPGGMVIVEEPGYRYFLGVRRKSAQAA